MKKSTARAKSILALMALTAASILLPACASTGDGGDTDTASLAAAAETASADDPSSNNGSETTSATEENADSSDQNTAEAEGAAPSNIDVATGEQSQDTVAGSVGAAGNAEQADTAAVESAPAQNAAAAVPSAPQNGLPNDDPFAPTVANGANSVGSPSGEATSSEVTDPVAPEAAEAPKSSESDKVANSFPATESVAPVSETEAAPQQATVAADEGTPSVLPEDGTFMPYVIQKGDTLQKIAGKIFGDKSRWQELAKTNNLEDANQIYAGDVVLYRLDGKSKSFASDNGSAPRKIVKVQKGDTLWSLAARELGDAKSWRTLWKNNPQIQNPDRIYVGYNLVVVGGRSVVASK